MSEFDLKQAGETLTGIKQDFQVLQDTLKKADKEREEHGKVLADTQDKLKQVSEALDKKDKHYEKELEKRDAKIAALETQAKRPLAAGPGEVSEEKSAGHKAFVKYLRSGREAWSAEEKSAHEMETKDLTLSSDAQAGYLASPPAYMREIIRSIVDFSPVRELGRVMSISTTSVQAPRRTAVATGGWTAENATRTENTALAFTLEDIAAHENYVFYDVSQQLLEDAAFDIEAVLREEFALAFSVLEGTAFISGTGAGQPEGVMTNASVSATTTTGSTTLDSAASLFFMDVFYAIKAGYRANATWLCNDTSLADIRQMRDGNSQFLWQPGLAPGEPSTILGRPFRSATDMPAPTTGLSPVVFGDFRRGYWIVDRIGMGMLRDPYTQAASGLVRIWARRRTGGQVVDPSAFQKMTLA